MNKILLMFVGVIITLSMIMSPILQMSYAHQRALYEINGKDYLFVIGSANEPLYVDDKTAATLMLTGQMLQIQPIVEQTGPNQLLD